MEPPVSLRAAGVGVVVEGLALLGFGVVLAGPLAASFGVWGFFLPAGAGLVAVGVALVIGKRGARGPAVVVQILLLGVAYYTAVPGSLPQVGVPVAVLAAATLAGVVSGPARDWAAQ